MIRNYATRHPMAKSGWGGPVGNIQLSTPGFNEYRQRFQYNPQTFYTPRPQGRPPINTPQFNSPANAGHYQRIQNPNYTPSQYRQQIPGKFYNKSYQQTPGIKGEYQPNYNNPNDPANQLFKGPAYRGAPTIQGKLCRTFEESRKARKI